MTLTNQKTLAKITENLDYIKHLNNQILGELREIHKHIPTKQDFQQISYLLENSKPRQILEAKELLHKVEKQVINLEQAITTVKGIVES